MKHQKMYDRICNILTCYENCEYEEEWRDIDYLHEFYSLLVNIANELEGEVEE